MSDCPEQNNEKRTVPGVFVWDMVRKALRAAEEGVYCWLFENDEFDTTFLRIGDGMAISLKKKK